MSIAAQFAANVLVARERAKLSQEAVSFRAELHRTEISQLERGLRVARIDTLVKLAAALEVEPGDLLRGIVWRPGETRPGAWSHPPAS